MNVRIFRNPPLSVAYILIAVLFMALFTPLLWTTLNNSAVHSVGLVRSQLHMFTMEQLRGSVQAIYTELKLVASVWSAASDSLLAQYPSDSAIQELGRFTFKVLNASKDLSTLTFVASSGRAIGALRVPEASDSSTQSLGDVYIFECPPPPIADGSGSPPRIPETTYWYVRAPNVSKGSVAMYVTGDWLSRPWFVDVMAAQMPVFSASFKGLAFQTEKLALSMPVFAPRRSGRGPGADILGVISVSYPFDGFLAPLQHALRMLGGHGLLFILGEKNVPIAKVSSAPSLIEQDIDEVLRFLNAQPDGFSDLTVKECDISTFGSSTVMQVLISDSGGADTVVVAGLHIEWKLVVVIPKQDYLSPINQSNARGAVETSVCFAVFLLLLFVVTWVMITRPLHRLVQMVAHVQSTLTHAMAHTGSPTHSVSTGSTSSICSNRMLIVCAREVHQLHTSLLNLLTTAEQFTAAERPTPMAEVAIGVAECGPTANNPPSPSAVSLIMEKYKDILFAGFCEKVRTALACSIGLSEMLKNALKSTQSHEPPLNNKTALIDNILRHNLAVEDAMEDFIDMRNLQTQSTLALQKKPFDVCQCIEEVMEATQRMADESGVVLVFAIEENVPRRLVGDKARLKRILKKLVENAIRFSCKGDPQTGGDPERKVVSVKCSLESSDGATPNVLFQVKDHGVGMDCRQVARLFCPLERSVTFCQDLSPSAKPSTDSSSTAFRPTPCSLVMAKVLVEQMGGTLVGSSAGSGLGSEFCFVIPLDPPPESLVCLDSPPVRAKIAIIDSLAQRNTAVQSLVQYSFGGGVRLVSVPSVSELISTLIFDGSNEEGGPTLWIVFLYRSDFASLEVAAEAQRSIEVAFEQQQHHAQLKIVWIESPSAENDTVAPNRMVLPVTTSKLRAVIEATNAPQTSRNDAGAVSTAQTTPRPGILLVHSCPTLLSALQFRLQQQGFDPLSVATSGKEVSRLLRAASLPKFGFIIAEANLPDMDGIALLRLIRSYPQLAQVPITFLAFNPIVAAEQEKRLRPRQSSLGGPVEVMEGLVNLEGFLGF